MKSVRKNARARTSAGASGAECKPHYLKIADNIYSQEEHFVWAVADDTMAPEFQPGDCVLAWNLRPTAGDVVVVRTQDGSCRLRRYAGVRKEVIGVVFEHWRNLSYRPKKGAFYGRVLERPRASAALIR